MGMYSDASKSYSEQPCTNCGKVHVKGQWWNLSNYFGINGYFCPDCYDLVSHNPLKKPNNPKDYKAIAVKQMLMKTVSR